MWDFLFSRDGRFARVHWWVALLFWGLVFSLLSKAATSVLPFAPQACATRQSPGSTATLCVTNWRLLLPLQAFLVLVSLPPMIKRLHDRERPVWWAYVYLALVLGPVAALSVAGPELIMSTPAAVRYVFGASLALSALGALAALFDLGLLRGTGGPNAYGDEPKHLSNLRG